jgi:CD2 antigen cytoplasmic tail-binding protein 2
VDEKSANIYKLDGDEEDETSDEDEDEEDKLNITGDQDATSQIETFKKMILYMKPGESVLKAIKRLGSSSKSSQSVGTMSASQRWLKKKNQTDQQAKSSKESEASAADKEALDKLTGFANHFIDRGFYDIYEETYEKLKYKIDEAENVEKNAAKNFDIFADDVDESDLGKPSSTNKKADVLEGLVIFLLFFQSSVIILDFILITF